jgi:hypothetical protein
LFGYANDLFFGANGGGLDQIFSAISLLADQQKKHSDSYQQGKQSTDSQRQSPVPSVQRLRSSALLRCSDAKPEEQVTH